ncbi:hypothetical protein [Nonomuraea sp. NPDC050643]|uniref:hypothetical protein n=1 Tax=Nonomuraea sp. NPDC050643 TaxID=3155660 RepID=UPI0033C26145
MYLVHAELRPKDGGIPPEHTGQLIFGCRRPADGIEHVVLHADGSDGGLVGLFVLAPSVEEAEHTAAAVCRRALDSSPELAGFLLGRCGVRIVPEYYDQRFRDGDHGRDMPRQD